MTNPQPTLEEIQQQLNALRAENAELKNRVETLTAASAPPEFLPDDTELQRIIEELEADGLGQGMNEQEMKQELSLLLDELEQMIHSMNISTGMGMRVPAKIDEVRRTLELT